MIVTFYSACKGTGQTTTVINFGMLLSLVKEIKTVILDLNSCKGDVKYHLSKARCIKGLGLYSDMFEASADKYELLKGSIEAISENLHMLSHDQSIELPSDKLDYLINYLSYKYDMVLIDTSLSAPNDILLQKAQCLISILNQNKSVVEEINNCKCLQKYSSKAIFVINKYMDKYNEEVVSYRADKVLRDMNDCYIKQKLFTLPFDVQIMNMSNDVCLQGYIKSIPNDKTEYSKTLHQLYKYIINPNEHSNKKGNEAKYYYKGLVNWREKIRCLVN